jgi:uncharacterized membrane protein YtjA (UPF0391 family)
MSRLALIALILALAAAIVGFGGFSIALSTIGQGAALLFFLLFVGCLILDRRRGRLRSSGKAPPVP